MKIVFLTLIFLSSFICSASARAEPLDLSIYHGQVVYLDFWASWCIPCKKSFPFMNELQKRFKQQGLTVIAINVDIDRQDADDFLTNNPAQFEIVYDPEGELMAKFEVQAMPTSFLFDRQGQLLGSHLGFKPEDADELSSAIENLLQSPAL